MCCVQRSIIRAVEDVFDYRYLMNDEYIELLYRESQRRRSGSWRVEKDYDEDLGIEFENGLMDDYTFLQQPVHVLLYRPDAAGNEGDSLF